MNRGRSSYQPDSRRRTTFTWVRCRKSGLCGTQVVKELRMADKRNRNTIWALLLSLLALITINNQLVVTPNEMIAHCYRDYPLNDQQPSLSELSLLLGSSGKHSLHGTRIFLSLSYDPSTRKIIALGTSVTLCL